ncbi:AD-dependent pyridine nucleotide-disulfide oxidoreductase [Oscillochloris trichoides DG-6]|uniref:NADH:ubiquinone reductase (non-electrogenic) n=1 Tax=Oscillochloris trichoides DG-6 TaxID=765420 RepID=E1IH65_9CHLR|nr:NAD(P)/FAD-dependent oxidoreductase [Oscillochloris trichoides]EFO79540.1 AD-dependent pyridine nucleotide-disulfide oxidoreductase [Oscillochloris trichoides DG-6]
MSENQPQMPESSNQPMLGYSRNGARPWPSARPRVVIIGAGFGGINAARALANKDVDVLMIDRNNYHGFWPLLYQVATAGLEPESVAYPVRAIIRRFSNVSFMMAEVTRIDCAAKMVYTPTIALPYDYLIIAAGSANNYFGNDSLAEHTYGLKDLDDAERLRNHVLSNFEYAVSEQDPAIRQRLMTLVIVGGGPTGVELAGAFIELVRHVLVRDYPMLDISEARVVLVEASEHILAVFPEGLRRSGLRRLEKMGVEVRLKTMVANVDAQGVTFGDGSRLETGSVIWAAGVRGAHLGDSLGMKLARGGRVPVQPTLNLATNPDVFVIGDMAYLDTYKPGVPYPMIAPVAVQMAELAAHNILAKTRRRPLRSFHYFDKGNMATIGRRGAVMDAFGVRLSGFLAWMGWLLVHLMFLVGFRNRVIVLLNWAYSYFTYDRGVRLISGLKPESKQHEYR